MSSLGVVVDELGMLRHVTESSRLRALRLVRQGRLYDLGRVLDEQTPVFPGRFFRQTLVTTAHHANTATPVGENEVNWITEVFSSTSQLGTHLDTLGHLQMGGRGFGGHTVAELASPFGLTRLGAETGPSRRPVGRTRPGRGFARVRSGWSGRHSVTGKISGFPIAKRLGWDCASRTNVGKRSAVWKSKVRPSRPSASGTSRGSSSEPEPGNTWIVTR